MKKDYSNKIRTAVIGVGYRGGYILQLMLKIEHFEVVALADPAPDLLERIAPLYSEMSVLPTLYQEGVDDYCCMLQAQQLDLVVIASPWKCHLSQALAALRINVHVAIEIKGALEEGEYDQLIEESHQRGLFVFPLENTVFMRDIMSIYCMIEQNVLGEIVFCQGGYRHDLRKLFVDGLGNFGVTEHSESVWRSPFYEQYNGDLYPTHGIAPLCVMLQCNRGNRFAEFSAFATRGYGIKSAIRANGGAQHPDLKRQFVMGDVITSIIKLASGAQITLLHDTTLPRPKSFNYEIQGTKGIWNGDRHAIYIEGRSPFEQWESDEVYLNQYIHPFWKRWGDEAIRHDQHHQGMDYIMLRALAESFYVDNIYPVSITDLALWASVTPLSIRSIAEGRTIRLD